MARDESDLLTKLSIFASFRVAVDLAADLLADHFDQNPLVAASVELAVEYLLPGAEVELPIGDRDDDFPPHHLPLQVGVGVVLACAVVPVNRWVGIERGEVLEPDVEIVVQARFIVIDKHRCGDVHGVAENNPLDHA